MTKLWISLLFFVCLAPNELWAQSTQAPPKNSPLKKARSKKTGSHGLFKNETIQVGQRVRKFRLWVPSSVDLKKPAPLVLAFHGMLDNKDFMPVYTKLDQAAQKHGWILVYPQARGIAWPLLPSGVPAELAFFDSLLKKLKSRYVIDAKRVHLMGMSNGGYFINVIALARSEQVASIVIHSSSLGLLAILPLKAKVKYSVFIIHGDADRLIPIQQAKDTAKAYRRAGHKVRTRFIKGLGHIWAVKHKVNDDIAAFISAKAPSKKNKP